jgi:hypothetical protein
MGRTKDTLKATGAGTLILIAPIVEAMDECHRLPSAICGIESPILPHGHAGDPMAPPPFRQLITGTNTGTATDTAPPPPQDVPQVLWEQADEEWNFAALENVRIRRSYVAPLVQPIIATGTQVESRHILR